MIDLSKIPFEILEAEYKRRRNENYANLVKKEKASKCCKNCAYRISGKFNGGIQQTGESWVCYKKPKTFANSYSGRRPDYLQAYCSCGSLYTGCESFLSIHSEEGKKVVNKLSKMSDRVV